MEAINCIKTRRSIRKFLDKEVPDEIIEKLIDCARHAPFSNYPPQDYQPWEFIIVKDKEIKEKFAEPRDEENKFIADAPVIITICVDKRRTISRWVEDGSCAAMNILLAAHALGLGAVWLCGYSKRTPEIGEVIKKTLKLPEYIQPVVIIPVGYPNETPEPKKLREINEMTHFDKYG